MRFSRGCYISHHVQIYMNQSEEPTQKKAAADLISMCPSSFALLKYSCYNFFRAPVIVVVFSLAAQDYKNGANRRKAK